VKNPPKVYRNGLCEIIILQTVKYLVDDMAPTIRLMWAIASTQFGVYVIVQNLNVPLILQPQVLTVLSLISWGQVHQ